MSLDGFSGASGIKYGLNIRGIPKKPVVQKPKVPVANAFQADSDDVRFLLLLRHSAGRLLHSDVAYAVLH